MTSHFIIPIDIPQIDNDRPGHDLFEDCQIERSELLPFSHDDERLGIFCAFVRAFGIFFACSIPAGSNARTLAPMS